MCLPINLKETHGNCIEKSSRRDCPVCLEDIHTSLIPSHVPPCNHLMHNDCFNKLIKSGNYNCPICGTSLSDMKPVWRLIDQEISETPLPETYRDLYVQIYCRDCNSNDKTDFHFLGNKCSQCSSYNTVRDSGPLLRKENDKCKFLKEIIFTDLIIPIFYFRR